VGDDRAARLWDLSGRLITQLGVRNVIKGIFSPDKQIIATVQEDARIRLWDFSGRQVAEFQSSNKDKWSYGVSFSPKGEYVVIVESDGIVRLHRVEGLNDLLTRGCNWLKDYFINHPEARKELKVCNNR
jgi:WD40 repeat protein